METYIFGKPNECDCQWPKITKDTPLEDVKAIHRRIWEYVIIHDRKPDTPYFNNCVLCEYVNRDCYRCPAKWTGGHCSIHAGEYSYWHLSINPERRRKAAEKIRDIQFKDEDWPIVTKDTPLDEIKAIHRRIWDYVMEHGHKPDTPYCTNNILCEYVHLHSPGAFNCALCPVTWYGGEKCYLLGAEYDRWHREGNPEKKREYARQIRNVHFRDDLRSTVEKFLTKTDSKIGFDEMQAVMRIIYDAWRKTLTDDNNPS